MHEKVSLTLKQTSFIGAMSIPVCSILRSCHKFICTREFTKDFVNEIWVAKTFWTSKKMVTRYLPKSCEIGEDQTSTNKGDMNTVFY